MSPSNDGISNGLYLKILCIVEQILVFDNFFAPVKRNFARLINC